MSTCDYCHSPIDEDTACKRDDPDCNTDESFADHCPECCPYQEDA